MDENARQAIFEQTMLKKAGNAEDIAKTAIFLIKDADYITGQISNVDGGRTLYS